MLGQVSVCPAESAPAVSGDGWQGVGSGWLVYGEQLSEHYGAQVSLCDSAALPRAWDVALLAERDYRHGMAVSAELALPVYLRDSVVNRP